MRYAILYLPLLLTGLILGACDQADVEVRELEWTASVAGTPAFPGVTGASTVRTEGEQTIAQISIQGATPGAAHPWHVHRGSCQTGGPIEGDMMAYPDLEIGAGGTANAIATIAHRLSAGVSYFVNVHLSQDDLATIVACGNLSGQGTSQPPGGDDY
jgi:hypothetical protein